MQQYPWIVVKYGGTSVADSSAWPMIASRLQQYLQDKKRPLVVCSALAGVSDRLAGLPALALQNHHGDMVAEIKSMHRQFAKALDLDADDLLKDWFAELDRLTLGISLIKASSPALLARIMGLGELMSTTLASAYLQTQQINTTWFDARTGLRSITDSTQSSDNNILSARCEVEPNPSLQASMQALSGDVIVTQGFIASNSQGEMVLLGRGGSDTSAAYFAAQLAAERCEIWTDVPGIYTTNPRAVPAARLLTNLSFDEAKEIAATGAKVLHPYCLDPLSYNKIPLSIHCTHKPELEGTAITADVPLVTPQVKAISAKTGVIVISMETTKMWQQVGFMSTVFACFGRHKVSVDLVATSENNVTVTLDSDKFSYAPDVLQALLDDLKPYCEAEIIAPCAAVSLVGRNIRSILHQLASVFEVFKSRRIYLLSQATNDLNLTFVVDEAESETLLHKIHALLFETPNDASVFGRSWQNAFPKKITTDYWWYQRKDELLDLAKTHSPAYVYDLSIVKQRADALLALKQVDQVFYAMKANSHPAILNLLADAGVGFECVSTGEINHVLQHIPNIDPNRILFTPNFAAKEAYQYALSKGVIINLDNIHPVEHWPELFAGKDIMLRIDPGLGRGHHKYVQTGGVHSKFGIATFQLPELKVLLSQHNITVTGLHVHFGSGVMDAASWSENAIFLAKLTEEFPQATVIDLGGGLGVPEKFGQRALDLSILDDALAPIKNAYPNLKLWLEPGRFLVSEAGVLLTTVTQLKHKESVEYIGVNTGMNSLIRPMLYSAYHEIVNLSRIDAPRTEVAHIVGPICETGDTLGYSRVMPVTAEGDVLLIANAGAYGHVMSSSYNLRPPAEELII